MVNLNYSDGFVIFSLNPSIYDLESIYSVAFQFIEVAFIVLDGDPEVEIKISLSNIDDGKNSNQNLEVLAKEFLNDLINYRCYKSHVEKTKVVRSLMIEKAIGSQYN